MASFKNTLILLLSLSFCSIAYSNPIEITNCQQLNDIPPAEGDYVIVNDIDCSGHTYTTITGVFKGTLDGNGHTISNLTINKKIGGNASALFEGIGGVSIANIVFENVVIPVNYDGSRGDHGLIAGAVFFYGINNIANIEVRGLKIGEPLSSGYTGGIVGRIPGATLNLSNIHIEGITLRNNYGSAGGLIGQTGGSAQINIENSSVTSLATFGAGHKCNYIYPAKPPSHGEPGRPEYDHFYDRCAFGGFIGDVQGGKISIKESFATGSISNIQFTGGLIGLAGQAPSGTIDIVDSYAQVAVNSASQYAGGLIGGALAGTINLANVYAAAPVKSQSSAGGIVGSLINSALLATESYYDKQITGTNNSGDFYSIGLNTSQMKAGPQNPAFVFGNWNQEIWDFQQGYYPTRP